MYSVYDTSEAPSNLYLEKKHVTGFRLVASTAQSIIFLGLLTIFVGLWVYIFVGWNNYMDYGDKCFIKIRKDILRGNKETIFSALHLIKIEDPMRYSDMCKYVDKITESTCLLGNPKTPKLAPLNTDGCYVKGSKTIFIQPVADNLPSTIELRKEQILKYSQFSKEYWINNETKQK